MSELFDWRFGLPADSQVNLRTLALLTPWLKSLVSLSEQGVASNLMARWEDLPAWLIPLKDRILEAGAPHLIGVKSKGYLGVTLGKSGPFRPRADESEIGGTWTIYVAEPAPTGAILASLKKCGLASHTDAHDFLERFDSLRESEPKLAGGFLPFQQWKSLRKHDMFGVLSPKAQREWGDAVVFFHARNGDRFILHPSGVVAVVLFSAARVERRWNFLREFVLFYADFLETRYPLDGYGPDDEALAARGERQTRKTR